MEWLVLRAETELFLDQLFMLILGVRERFITPFGIYNGEIAFVIMEQHGCIALFLGNLNFSYSKEVSEFFIWWQIHTYETLSRTLLMLVINLETKNFHLIFC